MYLQVIMLCVCVVIFIGNGLIIPTIKQCKSLSKATIYLLANLAVADTLIAIFMAVDAIINLIELDSGCVIPPLIIMASGVSSAGVILLCLQSFLYIAFPTRFGGRGIGSVTCLSLITLAWILGGLQCAGAYLYMDKQECRLFTTKNNKEWMRVQSMYILVGCIDTIVMVVLQVSSILLIRQQNDRLHRQVHGAPSSAISEPARKLKVLKKKSRAVSMITSVLILFLVSFLPLSLVWDVFAFCLESCAVLERKEIKFLSVLTLLNSVGNIVIYWKKNEEFRTSLSATLKCGQRIGVVNNGAIEMN